MGDQVVVDEQPDQSCSSGSNDTRLISSTVKSLSNKMSKLGYLYELVCLESVQDIIQRHKDNKHNKRSLEVATQQTEYPRSSLSSILRHRPEGVTTQP
ncbi:hypothetical protein EPI10_034215 [Gossypium australe]|uniref:Uncharacterized protein n=1 Tax=Gossypium australe TaxID=47621 RepID=A0A5B6TGA4_9ROSI|nr:hypothetical protein EPI10_034215 [Gossypium australe]